MFSDCGVSGENDGFSECGACCENDGFFGCSQWAEKDWICFEDMVTVVNMADMVVIVNVVKTTFSFSGSCQCEQNRFG